MLIAQVLTVPIQVLKTTIFRKTSEKQDKSTESEITIFWDITRRRVVIIYRRFGSTYRSRLQFLTLDDVTDMLFRNVGKNYHTTLRNTPEERRSHQHRRGSLKSSS
jgi:hypothetical protein